MPPHSNKRKLFLRALLDISPQYLTGREIRRCAFRWSCLFSTSIMFHPSYYGASTIHDTKPCLCDECVSFYKTQILKGGQAAPQPAKGTLLGHRSPALPASLTCSSWPRSQQGVLLIPKDLFNSLWNVKENLRLSRHTCATVSCPAVPSQHMTPKQQGPCQSPQRRPPWWSEQLVQWLARNVCLKHWVLKRYKGISLWRGSGKSLVFEHC